MPAQHRQREGSYMACLALGKELGANEGVCLFALLCGAVFMLTFASLLAAKPRPPAQVDEFRSYQVKKGEDSSAQSRFR
jgi:hypothetical protein